MNKISNYFYEREFRSFSKRRTSQARSTKGVLNHKKTAFFIISLLFIPIINWLVFWLFVNLQSIVLAFQSPIDGHFTFDNFVIFWRNLTTPIDNVLGLALRNTALYFGSSILIILPLSLVIAYFLYKKIWGHKIFRIVFFLPAIISGIALVTSYSTLIAPNGPIMRFLARLGVEIDPSGLLGNKETATPTILVYTILTSFTTNVLLFSGAMARVPSEVLESAKLEGCSPFRELVEIIFPLIWPTFSTQLVLAMTGLFTASGPILLFDPLNKQGTITLSYWIFREAYGAGLGGGGVSAYNLVSCTGLCFTLVGFPIILLVRKFTDKIDAVEY